MTAWSLIALVASLSSIHYGDIVDEHRDQKDFMHYKQFLPLTPMNIFYLIHSKVYGAWLFNNPIGDRLSLIFVHAVVVFMIENIFGLIPALLFATSPASLFVGVWRNGRRYSLSNLIALSMVAIGPVGVLLYPLTIFTHIGGVPSIFLYLFTPYWYLSGFSIIGIFFWNWRFKRVYTSKKKKMPRNLYLFHRAKVIPFFKTMAYFFYRAFVPQFVFMYESWFQSYGVDKEQTRKMFAKDSWFYGGIICSLFVIAGIIYPPTRNTSWWFLIFFMPYSNLVTNHQHNNLRYAVLPMIGLYAAAATIFPWWIFVPTIVGNFACYVMSMRQFVNDIELYNFHFKYSPKSIAPYFIVGQHCVKTGDANQAEHMAKSGLKMNPNHYGLLMVLAHIGNSARDGVLKKMESLKRDQIFKRQKALNIQLNELKNLK
jgi:hypothetical protein